MRLTIAFIFLAITLLGAIAKSASPATSPTTNDQSDTAICRSLLNSACDDIKTGIAQGELRSLALPVGGKNFAKARQAFSQAALELQDADLRHSDPALAASVLARDAWFEGKIDHERGKAIDELIDSLSLKPDDAVVQYMLADLYTDDFMFSNWKDENFKALAIASIEKTLAIDATMAEAYRLRAELYFTTNNHKQVMDDYQRFMKYSDKIHPEIFFNDDATIKAVKDGVRSYLIKGELTTQPIGSN